MKELSFYIKLLKYCNLHCSYCYEQGYFKDPHILTLPQMKIILKRIKAYARKNKINKVCLSYTGGEILTLGDNRLASLFKLSYRVFDKSKIKIKLNIQTNLTLVNEKYIELLKKYRVSVGTSFDVYGGERRFRNGESADPAIIDKMIMMLKARLRFGAIAVITRSNFKKGTAIYDFYKNITTGFHTLKLHPWAEKYCKEKIIDVKEYTRCLKDIARKHLERRWPKIPVSSIDAYIDLLRKGPGPGGLCMFSKDCLGSNVFIENNGDVYPCCSLRYKELYLGNILRIPLEEILGSPILTRLKKRHESIMKECQGCPYLEICNGGCMAYSYLEGNILRRSPSYCAINRAMFKYIGQKLKKRGEKLAVRI
jgi:uncharacterized protein